MRPSRTFSPSGACPTFPAHLVQRGAERQDRRFGSPRNATRRQNRGVWYFQDVRLGQNRGVWYPRDSGFGQNRWVWYPGAPFSPHDWQKRRFGTLSALFRPKIGKYVDLVPRFPPRSAIWYPAPEETPGRENREEASRVPNLRSRHKAGTKPRMLAKKNTKPFNIAAHFPLGGTKRGIFAKATARFAAFSRLWLRVRTLPSFPVKENPLIRALCFQKKGQQPVARSGKM